MTHILSIETATTNCSVSVSKNGELISLVEENEVSYSHSEKLHIFIKKALEKASLSLSNLDAIAVSKGPGSYTGLRIGVSAAKGLCFSLDKPLLSIPTLESLTHQTKIEKGYLVPMLDARRMEVYTAVFDRNYHQVEKTKAEVVTENSFQEFLEKDRVYFFGDGAEKCKAIITHKNAYFLAANSFPSAKEMGALAFTKYNNQDFEDVAYFEPFYLKDFMIGG